MVENPVTNLVSMFGTSDVGRYLLPRSLGVDPLDDLSPYLRWSPLLHAGSMLGASAVRLAQDEALVQWMEQWLRSVEGERERG